jgi:hypothetical protein
MFYPVRMLKLLQLGRFAKPKALAARIGPARGAIIYGIFESCR